MTSYNHLHLPEKLVFATATAGVLDSLRFVYSAAGQKVAKLVYDHRQPGVVRTDYLGAFQYERDKLQWLSTATGRALREVDSISGAIGFRYEHTIKDHLGNLRLSFRRSARRTYHATLEANANLAAIDRRDFDPASVSPPIANAEQATTSVVGARSAKLYANGTHPQPIGPTKLWAVQGGDTLRVEVAAYYASAFNSPYWHYALPTFLAGWLSQPTPGRNPDGSSTRRNFNWLQVGLAAGLGQMPSFGAGVPHGYLRLLVYQADSTVIRDTIVAITSQARMNWEPLVLPRFELPKGAAYAQVYVANESNEPVWFDDLRIEHWPGLLVQENHYDPFGLALVGLDQATPGLRPLNLFQYNGKEEQNDFGLNWNDYGARFYDPALARWNVIDPKAGSYVNQSPYNYVLNNPLNNIDPDGRDVLPSKLFLRSAYGKAFQDLRKNNSAFQQTIGKYESNKNFNLKLSVDNAKVLSAGAFALTENFTGKTSAPTSHDTKSYFLSSTNIPNAPDYQLSALGVVTTVAHEAIHEKLALTAKNEDDEHNTYNSERGALSSILTEYSKDNNLNLSEKDITAISYSGQQQSKEFKSYIKGLAKESGTSVKETKANYDATISNLLYQKKTKQ